MMENHYFDAFDATVCQFIIQALGRGTQSHDKLNRRVCDSLARRMAICHSQVDLGLTIPAFPVALSLRSPGAKAWSGKINASSGRHYVCQVLNHQGMQEYSWQDFFLDPIQWWDNRRSKQTLRQPDFRHNKSKEALWLSNWCNPAGLGSQLAVWETQIYGGIRGTSGFISNPVQAGLLKVVPYEADLQVWTCRKLCEDGDITEAVNALDLLVQRGCKIRYNLFYRLLKRCIVQRDLVLGRRLHALTVKSGYESNAFLANHLICMYASHGSLVEAMQVFCKVSAPHPHMWASIIFAYARHGQPTQAIGLYRQILESSVKPDKCIFLAVLKACACAGDLTAGKDVHARILASAGTPDIVVQNSIVHMYAKCGSLKDARKVFDRLLHRDVVTWNAMIAGYAQQGMGQEALNLYSCMQQEGVTPPNSVTFICLLQACASVAALHQGKQLHTQIEEQGLQADIVLGNSLVNMYAKCGSLGEARTVFDGLSQKDVVTWTAMIAGFVDQGMGQEALGVYRSMQGEGITPPDSVTFVCLLQACASAAALHQGKQLHAQIEEQGLQTDLVIGASLVNMYAKCGSLKDAQKVFAGLPQKDVVTWTAMIAGYVEQGMGQEALMLYSRMGQEGISPPDCVTFVCLLQACASVASLHHGKQIHAQIEERGLQADIVVGGSLVHMYQKCGSLEEAEKVFDGLPKKTVVTWTAMIAGYVEQGMGQEALGLYSSMQEESITPPDSVTFVCLLQACASVAALHQGKQLHAQIEDQGLEADIVVGNSLVNMYAKCGSLDDAQRVFDGLSQKDVVTWTAMIAAYAQEGMGQEALSLYNSMHQEGITLPNSVTFVCLLQACASVAALPLGKQLHAQIVEQGFQADGVVGPSLVNMYAKCGTLEDAQLVFDLLPEKEVMAWGALIAGYASQGDSEIVFDLVARMNMEDIQPDGLTLLSVLTVCSHVGLVDKGREFFESMRTDYGISPTIEHYTCMMDLLGRAGHLEEVVSMVKNMPFQPNRAVWMTLLGACRKWSNVEVGQQAFEFAVALDDKDAAPYVLMSNIFVGAQMWDEAKEVQARRVKSGAWKQPGQSWWTDMRGVMHAFVVGDRKHPDIDSIHARLEQLVLKMKKEGYVPDLNLSLRDMLADEKEAELCLHRKKLANAYA